jgi:5'-nucleotidase
MTQPTLLITNDDGIESPFLPRMVRALAPLGRVRVVVPADEQSWKAKSMTRYGRVTVQPHQGLGVEAWTVAGTPSDCVNLAIHHLFGEAPDWVISGINIGHNVGAGFVINSGTVGAALEGALCGLPAVAFSTYVAPGLFQQWTASRQLTGAEAEAILESTPRRMAEMLANLLQRGLPPGAMLLNVNFPGAVGPHTPVHWVPLEDNRYGSLFVPEGGGFVHRYQGNLRRADPGSAAPDPADRDIVLGGAIAVTALSLAGLSLPAPEAFRL